jgi:hypothetical protein
MSSHDFDTTVDDIMGNYSVNVNDRAPSCRMNIATWKSLSDADQKTGIVLLKTENHSVTLLACSAFRPGTHLTDNAVLRP